MLGGRTVSIDLVMEQLYRNYGFENVDKAEVAEWIWESMGIIGCLEPYKDKPWELKIEDYRAPLPVDLYAITAVREKTTGIIMREMTNLFNKYKSEYGAGTTEIIAADADPATGERYETLVGPGIWSEYYTFKTQGNFIYCGMETATLEMQYKAIPIDIVTGMPTLPDNPTYLRGVVSFIGERLAFRLMLKDLLSERKYDIILKDYTFNVGAAHNICKLPDPAMMETMINRWKSTYKGPAQFDTGMMYLGSRE